MTGDYDSSTDRIQELEYEVQDLEEQLSARDNEYEEAMDRIEELERALHDVEYTVQEALR